MSQLEANSYGFRVALPGDRATYPYTQSHVLPAWRDAPYDELVAKVLDEYPHPRPKRVGAFGLSGGDTVGLGFDVFVNQCLAAIGFDVRHVSQWISIINDQTRREKSDSSWSFGFPHTHTWVDAVTFIHFIQAPEGGGEHVVLPEGKDGPEVVIKPTLGTTAFVDGNTWHGVRPVTGATERIALLATAYGPLEPMVCSR